MLTSELVADLHRLAAIGFRGAARDWIKTGLRLHVFGKYSIYFMIEDDHMVVLRIVHGTRDLNAIEFGT